MKRVIPDYFQSVNPKRKVKTIEWEEVVLILDLVLSVSPRLVYTIVRLNKYCSYYLHHEQQALVRFKIDYHEFLSQCCKDVSPYEELPPHHVHMNELVSNQEWFNSVEFGGVLSYLFRQYLYFCGGIGESVFDLPSVIFSGAFQRNNTKLCIVMYVHNHFVTQAGEPSLNAPKFKVETISKGEAPLEIDQILSTVYMWDWADYFHFYQLHSCWADLRLSLSKLTPYIGKTLFCSLTSATRVFIPLDGYWCQFPSRSFLETARRSTHQHDICIKTLVGDTTIPHWCNEIPLSNHLIDLLLNSIH